MLVIVVWANRLIRRHVPPEPAILLDEPGCIFSVLEKLPRKDFYETAIAELRKEIEMVVARLKEQDSRIQRVSDRVQMSKLVVGGAKTTPR